MIIDTAHMERNCAILKTLIDTQLNHRSKMVDQVNHNDELFDNSIIHCMGARAFGYSHAVYDLYNPSTDIYIGHDFCCNELSNKLKEKRLSEGKIIKFGSISNANYNVDHITDIYNALRDNLEDVIGFTIPPVNKFNPMFDKTRLLNESISERQYAFNVMFTYVEDTHINMFEYVKRKVRLPNRSKECTQLRNSLNGFGDVSYMTKIYLDIGISCYMANSLRINNMLYQLFQILSKRCKDLVFIIT